MNGREWARLAIAVAWIAGLLAVMWLASGWRVRWDYVAAPPADFPGGAMLGGTVVVSVQDVEDVLAHDAALGASA